MAEYAGCVSTGSFNDGSYLRLGFDGIVGGYFLSFSNASLISYPIRGASKLLVSFDRRYTFSIIFHSIRRSGLPTLEVGELSNELVELFASSSIISFSDEGRLISEFQLRGSRAALRNLQECERVAFNQGRGR